ncbi:hypothetical protein LPTSP2_01400 [Leptospira ellinghausenii]|uniref:Uncharacterized protein n=1 Tax=Leptospira ellinghausenii TaxID=1917822 RepID=A0A2P2D8A6_9LEPT|nr:hypothetical protein LPTSP2_01400 [Leptospira ellinghausenii]
MIDIVLFAGEIVIATKLELETFKEAVSETEPKLAVIKLEPTPIVDTSPVVLIVATAVSDESQLIEGSEVRSCVVESEKRPTA